MNPGGNIFQERWFWLSILCGGFVLFLTLWFGFSGDQALAAYTVWVWKHYHLPPYVGVFDHNFPGIFLINRAALEIAGDTILGFRIFDACFQVVTLAAIYYVSRRLSQEKIAGFLAAVFYSLHYYSLGILDVFRPDDYAFSFMIMGVALCLVLEKRVCLRAVIAGLIAGFAFLIKPTYGLCWLVFGAWFLAGGIKEKSLKAWREEALFGVFCLAPAALVIFYYWRAGYIRDLYFATLWFNSNVYTQFSPLTFARLSGIFINLLLDHPVNLLLSIFAVAYGLAGKKEFSDRKLFWVLLALVLIGLFSGLVQNKDYYYHRDPFWGFALIFAGAGGAWIGGRLSRSFRPVPGKAAAAVFYLAMIFFMLVSMESFWLQFMFKYSFRDLKSSYLASARVYPSNSLFDQYRAAEYLKPLLRPGDQAAYFGMWASIFQWQAKAKSPSRFIYAQHLLLKNWRGMVFPVQEQFIKEYQESIIRSRPRFFLMYDLFWKSDHRDFINAHFSDLKGFIAQHYKSRKKFGEIEIFERAD